jgi:hypothetical protein
MNHFWIGLIYGAILGAILIHILHGVVGRIIDHRRRKRGLFPRFKGRR